MTIRNDSASDGAAITTPRRISVRSLTKRFVRRGGGGEVIPVRNISFEVDAREMVVLLGPSGCGKTTLLRCIAGLEKPDEGEIVINDQVVFSSAAGIFVPPNLRPISMVFQSYALWPHMTVFENVAYPLRSRGVPRSEIHSRVIETLRLVDLEALVKQYPGQISGGQQQRVALARAVVSRTGTVLFDEPLSNVDAKVREQLRGEIVRMQRTLGFSALYVTHDQVEAMGIGDRVAVLRDGAIDQIGVPEEIYTRPANRSVGAFIGSPNILAGSIASVKGSRITVKTAAGVLEVGLPKANGTPVAIPATGTSAFVLARPETISLGSEAGEPGENRLVGRIESRAFLGAYIEYVVAVGEAKLRTWSFKGERLPEGAEAHVSIAPQDIMLVGDTD